MNTINTSKVTNTPFRRDVYRTRVKRLDYINKPDTVYASDWLAWFTVIGCVVIDFFVNYVRWNLIMTESTAYVCMSAAACAIALDVPLAIAGVVLKRYDQGLCSKRERNLVMILAILVFAIAFAGSFGLTYVTRDIVFGVGSSATITNTVAAGETVAEQEGEQIAVLVAGIFSAVIPLLTSLASFVVSYFTYDPIGKRLYKYEKERIGLQNNLIDVEMAVAEADESYAGRLIARENDKCAEMKQMLNAQNTYLKELARVIISEKMTTPTQSDAIAQNGKAVFEEYQASEKPLENELPDYIMKQLKVNEENKIVAVNACPQAA